MEPPAVFVAHATWLAAVVAAGWILAVPSAGAHAAATAPEQYVRFLNDCSDDWGGHSAARDGHDLVALDVTERWVKEWNEPGLFILLTLGFGFAEFGSQGGPLRDEVAMDVGGATLRTSLRTMDNENFQADTGPGLLVPDLLLPVRPSLMANGQPDGSRFLLEYAIRFSTLGAATGDTIPRFFVQAWAREDRGDFMPGGNYVGGVASAGECPPSGHQGSGDPGTLYVRSEYRLRGVEHPYVSVRTGTDRLASSGNQAAFLPVTVKNNLSKTAQGIILSAKPPPGWVVEWEPGPVAQAGPLVSLVWEVSLRPQGSPSNGTLTLLIETDLGGRALRDIPVAWSAARATPSTPVSEATTSGVTLVPLLGALAIALVGRRLA